MTGRPRKGKGARNCVRRVTLALGVRECRRRFGGLIAHIAVGRHTSKASRPAPCEQVYHTHEIHRRLEMILGNVRASLTRDDAQLALQLIGRASRAALEEAEEALREHGVDALLDDPRLLQSLLDTASRLGMRASWPLFCYVIVRQSLRRAGEGDRALADYVAAIVLHFGARGRAMQISEYDDQEYDTLAALLDDVNDGDVRRSFLVRQHLGNYALWLSGLFPDRIEQRRWRRGGPDLEYYEEMGRRGFQMAADHRLAQENGLDALFREAAARFAVIRVALNEMSDSIFFPTLHTPERLMRQVKDESRWKRES